MSRTSGNLRRPAPTRATRAPLSVRRERLLAALDTITGEERLVLALLVYEGLTVDETARLLEIDPRTVQANCDRLLTELHRAVSGTRRRPSRAIPRETERAVLRRAM